MGQEAVHVFCGGGVKPSHDVQEPLSEVHCVFLAGGGGRCPVPGSRTPGRWRETSAWRHPREKAHHTARRPLVKAAGQADHHATRLQGDPAVLAPRAGGRRRGRRNLQKLQRGGRRGKAPPPEAQHPHARPRRLAMLPVRKSSAPAPQGQCRLFMHEMTPLRFGKRTKDITMRHPRDYGLIERLLSAFSLSPMAFQQPMLSPISKEGDKKINMFVKIFNCHV